MPVNQKSKKPLIVVALGGNALIGKGQVGTAEEHIENLKSPMKQIAKISKTHNVIITHGNGPQVGFLLEQQNALNRADIPKMRMDVLVAATQGEIGYMIESVLEDELYEQGLLKDTFFLTILSYVEVDENDPAFLNPPTKPIGPTIPKTQMLQIFSDDSEVTGAINAPGTGKLIKTNQGTFKEIKADFYRKVVPSPMPKRIFQYGEIRTILESQKNCIIITCGGGGMPIVTRTKNRVKKIFGIEAVIDKDLASAKLGNDIDAQTLVILTDVEKVCLNYGTPTEQALSQITLEDARQYIEDGHFAPGSMLTKVQACVNFLEHGGQRAIITNIENLTRALDGKSGTEFINDNRGARLATTVSGAFHH